MAKSLNRRDTGVAHPVDVHVGLRLRQRRTFMGLSQEKLGTNLGLTFQQVQKYERGANRIGASRLYELADILEVPVNFFFEGYAFAEDAQSAALAANDGNEDSAFEDPMASKESMELLRAYHAIPNAVIRRRVYDLARSLANMDELDEELSNDT